jgi:hypothetical protein
MDEGQYKYGQMNWRTHDVRFSIYLEALNRHLKALIDGEDVDPKSGKLHLSHIAANVAIIADAMYLGRLIDDRSIAGPASMMMEIHKATIWPLKSQTKVTKAKR